MVYKQFKLQVSLRVFLLVLTAIALSFFLLKEYLATTIFIFGLLSYQVYLLIQKLSGIAFEMKKFLDAINYDDFTQTFSVNASGDIQNELNKSLTSALDRFKELRSNRESDLMFYKSIAQHVDSGLIAFDPSGKVVFSNLTTKRLFSGIKTANILDFKEAFPALYTIFTNDDDIESYQCELKGKYNVDKVLIQKMTVYVKGEVINVFNITRVAEELEKVEIKAWESLITVLTHEIMNAMAPISSLSDTVSAELEYIKEGILERSEIPTAEDFEDLNLALNTIQQRSHQMSKLAEDFRVMAHLRESEPKHINLSELCKEILIQYEPISIEKGIEIELDIQVEGLMVTSDPQQLSDVIQNLIKNALEELEGKENGKVSIICKQDDQTNRPVLQVVDNGSGIETDALARIFVPFFTTKKGHTGIGLSLSRQIMRNNKGRLTVISSIDEGSEFTVWF
ncbi:PAS domain-containing sensor histidine kinase [Flammeovirga sp. EKP202]|uniref:sensor histidine kinase n=1 Tax=Flammeovirga sp. EKP202 TaxID=2770592 RepID=UPI00165ED70A|nr:HAMP domain-containing sensor histidine kinase [Flammeovirga sp. EKP202]MBD0401558.1 HAMP domain-containing histidine kinase [Flammeovirga sp. EKP202]